MPAYHHHFVPLDPPPATAEECDALQIIASMTYGTKSGHNIPVSFLGLSTGISVIAVTINEELSSHSDINKWMMQIVENAITAIRLTYDPAASPFYTDGGFITLMQPNEDPIPKYKVSAKGFINQDFRIDSGQFLGAYVRLFDAKIAPITALLAEARYPGTPPHYAVLSLVRAAELLWPDEKEFNEILDSRDVEFAALGLSTQSFRNALPRIRNRCAHGQGRGRGKPDPYTGIGYNSPLRPLVKLLSSIVARGLTEAGLQMNDPMP